MLRSKTIQKSFNRPPGRWVFFLPDILKPCFLRAFENLRIADIVGEELDSAVGARKRWAVGLYTEQWEGENFRGLDISVTHFACNPMAFLKLWPSKSFSFTVEAPR